MEDAVPTRVQLGPFEFDLKAGELRKGERKIRLQEQPFQILLMLVERSGELVTREDIKKKLWPNDTVVEFDHSIHAAINRLRQAFGDSADNPKYIETVARRGYRLLVPVECPESTPGDAPPSGEALSREDGTAAKLQLVVPTGLSGRTVSHYRVLDVIGGGGMGVVYKAEDLKLGRAVALKFLPEDLGSDPHALERFSREARAASSLDHPNICAIYEFGEHEGRPFMVMQLLKGQTLRDRLADTASEGALPLEELLEIGIQVSEGLQAAHEKGIIHRDIKPANIFVTDKGVCKILDFGLVKLLEADQEDEVAEAQDEPSNAVSRRKAASTALILTRTGMAMGTAGYMSPEQVRGERLDARTDLFSFGLVLYEMATGQRAFTGETAAVLKDAILNNMQVPVKDLNSRLPPKLGQIVNKLLEKNRKLRYQNASEMCVDLRSLKRDIGSGRRRPRWPLAVASAAALFMVIGTIFWLMKKKPSFDESPEPTFRRLSFGRGLIRSARFAHNGQSIIYSAAWDGGPVQLFSARADGSESRPLGVTADLLSISSSGEVSVLLNEHFAGENRYGTLAVMSLTGSGPRELLDDVQDADWSPDESKLAVVHYVGRDRCLLEFPLGKVLYETKGGAWLSHPRVSPRGDQIAFLEHPIAGDDSGFVGFVDLAGKKKILSGEFGSVTGLAWDASGDAILISGHDTGTTGAHALFRITLRGHSATIRRESGNLTLNDVSRDGRLLLTRDIIRSEVFGRIYPENKERELGWLGESLATDISSDGTNLLLSVQEEGSSRGYEVYLRKTDGSPAVRLGEGMPDEISPDGKWALTLSRSPTSRSQLLLLPIGAGVPKSLTQDSISHTWATWLPDGRRVIFVGSEPGSARRTWVQNVTGGKPVPVTPEGTRGHVVSPDGKLLVAVDSEQRFWLYPVDGGHPSLLPALKTGDDPIRWSADRKYLFVASGNVPADVYRIEVATARRDLLFSLAPGDAAGVQNIWPILLTPDGKSYVYSYSRVLADLYVASGIQ